MCILTVPAGLGDVHGVFFLQNQRSASIWKVSSPMLFAVPSRKAMMYNGGAVSSSGDVCPSSP